MYLLIGGFMKKVFFVFIPITMVIMGCATGGSTYNTSTISSTSSNIPTVDELDSAIREASDYLNGKIPQGNKAVFLNITSNYPDLSEYILSLLSENAVNDGVFSVVDRLQLDAIRSELNFQLSGEVDDDSAQSIGKMLGAQSIVSGVVSKVGSLYRLQVKAIEVQTAGVQGQWSKNIPGNGATITALIGNQSTTRGGSSGTAAAGGRTTTNSGGTAQSNAPAVEASTKPAEPPIQGTIVPGGSLSEKLAWLDRSADSHNTYILEVSADENIAPFGFEYRDTINITIVLRGNDTNRTIRLRSNGTMFRIGKNVTFILDNNITLHGHNGNTGSMVNIDGGSFRMRTGSAIIGNTGSGVYISSGTFEMIGGTVSGNTSASNGGGVYVSSGTFTMTGGTIFGNTAKIGGGAVYVSPGPLGIPSGTFVMRGGIITGNTALEYGGGVYIDPSFGNFTKSGGTITGYNSDPDNGNVVNDGSGPIARRGHAVYRSTSMRKETSAGLTVNMDSAKSGATGGWD
jgi:hypothetical protein